MAQGVAAHRLDDAGPLGRALDDAAKGVGMDVVAPDHAALRIG